VFAFEDACAYSYHLIWLYMPCASSSMVDSTRSKFFAYLRALLCRPRLTKNHRVVVPIIRRQSFVPVSASLLVRRGMLAQVY
jgi:hypothetical protein